MHIHASRFCLTLLLVSSAGCSHFAQTTSGADYLAAHNVAATAASQRQLSENHVRHRPFTEVLREAASIEPTLRFPARIGLARVTHGRLGAIPADEAELWSEFAQGLGRAFGAFVPVTPLVAQLASTAITCDVCAEPVKQIRLAGARQHLDAVLVYEMNEMSAKEGNLLAIANVSIIGGFMLPTASVSARASAQAMLIDVIQGYPYGLVQAAAAEEVATTTWGSGSRERAFVDAVRLAAVRDLSAEAAKLLKRLRWQLLQQDHTQ